MCVQRIRTLWNVIEEGKEMTNHHLEDNYKPPVLNFNTLPFMRAIPELNVHFKKHVQACPVWISWLEHHPVHQKAVGSTPG